MLDLDIKHQFSNSRFRLLSKDDRWGHEGITLVKLFGKIQERTEYTLIMLFFFFLRILINFWLVVCGLFSSWSGGGYSSLQAAGFWLWCFSGCRARALGHTEFSSCGSWALEHRLSSWGTQQVGSSQSWIEPTSPALASGFFTNGATREALQCSLNVVHDPQKHLISKSFFKSSWKFASFALTPVEKLPLPQDPMRLCTHPGVPGIASSSNYLFTLLSPSLSPTPLHPWGLPRSSHLGSSA